MRGDTHWSRPRHGSSSHPSLELARRADFVVRQRDGTHEAVDTKLARHAQPAHIIQLSFYTKRVARIQDRCRARCMSSRAGETETSNPSDYLAFYRQVGGALPGRGAQLGEEDNDSTGRPLTAA
jgi:uncharacterized protein